MKALILAGGYGKRLRPITDMLPKPLINVGGKPIIEWQIVWMKRHGIRDFVILAGHLNEKLTTYIKENEKRLDVSIEVSIEREPLGTGGAIKMAQKLINEERFLVTNGDVISDIDINRITLSGRYVGSISLAPLRSHYGVVKFRRSKVLEFKEKPILPEYWTSIGIYLLSEKIFEYVPEKGNIEDAFPKLAKLGLIKCVRFNNTYFRTIDSHKDIDEVSADITAKKVYQT